MNAPAVRPTPPPITRPDPSIKVGGSSPWITVIVFLTAVTFVAIAVYLMVTFEPRPKPTCPEGTYLVHSSQRYAICVNGQPAEQPR